MRCQQSRGEKCQAHCSGIGEESHFGPRFRSRFRVVTSITLGNESRHRRRLVFCTKL